MALSNYIYTSLPFVSLQIVEDMLKKGEQLDEEDFGEMLETNQTELVRLLLQHGAVVTDNMLTNVAKSGNTRMLLVLLNERENLPFTLKAIRSIAYGQSSDILVKAVQAVARGHPSRGVAQHYIYFLLKLDDLSAFGAFVQELNIDVDDLLEDFQETTPKPISGKKYERSQRGITRMKRLLGRTPDPVQVDKSKWVLEQNDLCFCWDIPVGEHDDMYIPVTRYGESAGKGYYGSVNYNDPSFTWYYVEPDSDFVLKTDRTFVARNKIQAFMLFFERPEIAAQFDTVNDDVIEQLMHTLKKGGVYYDDDEHRERILSDTEMKMNEDEEDGMTTFFRNWDTREVFFEGGGMDFLDEVLSRILMLLNYDVLVLTHQPGNYGRLVSECLDVRKRSVSFANIYEIM